MDIKDPAVIIAAIVFVFILCPLGVQIIHLLINGENEDR